MTDQAAAIREPWEKLFDQRRAATFAMWVFVVSEMLFFGAFFMAYSYARILHPHAFALASSHTNLFYGTTNTVILFTSSLTMVMASRAAEINVKSVALVCLAVTAALGVAFLIVKGFEYKDDFDKHLIPGPDFSLDGPAEQLFFSFYWILTVVHVIHLSIGIGAVGRLAWILKRDHLPLRSPQYEVTALYWSFVDIIWLSLFPLIYLGGRSS